MRSICLWNLLFSFLGKTNLIKKSFTFESLFITSTTKQPRQKGGKIWRCKQFADKIRHWKAQIALMAICALIMWYHQESNRGHKDFQSFALPTELWHHSIWIVLYISDLRIARSPLVSVFSLRFNWRFNSKFNRGN